MTGEKRPIRQISGNLQEFQAAISELTDAVAGSVGIKGYLEVTYLVAFRGNAPTGGLGEGELHSLG
jgi:hypothetical protein